MKKRSIALRLEDMIDAIENLRVIIGDMPIAVFEADGLPAELSHDSGRQTVRPRPSNALSRSWRNARTAGSVSSPIARA
jgi:hypothetical protein